SRGMTTATKTWWRTSETPCPVPGCSTKTQTTRASLTLTCARMARHHFRRAPPGCGASGAADAEQANDEGHHHEGDQLVGDVQHGEHGGPTLERVVGHEASGREPGPQDDGGDDRVGQEAAAVEPL